MRLLIASVFLSGCTGIALPFAAQKSKNPERLSAGPTESLPQARVVADLHSVEVFWAGAEVPQDLECAWVEPALNVQWSNCSQGSWVATSEQVALADKFGQSFLELRSASDQSKRYRIAIERSPQAPRGLFRPDGPAFIHALEPDGRGGFFVGGLFSYGNSHRVSGLVPVRSSGLAQDLIPSITTGLGFSVSGRPPIVRSVVNIDDGYIIGGRFSSYNGQELMLPGQPATLRRGLAKLKRDGSLDLEFRSQLSLNIPVSNEGVFSLQKFEDPSGSGDDLILVGGDLGGSQNLRILRADNLEPLELPVSLSIPRRVLKARYVPPTGSGLPARLYVASQLLSDDTVFSVFEWSGSAWTRSHSIGASGVALVRALDTTLHVSDFEVLGDDRIVIVGNFTRLHISNGDSFDSPGFAVLTPDGGVEESLRLNFDASPLSIELGTSDSDLWIGGSFTQVNGEDRIHLAQVRLGSGSVSVTSAAPRLGPSGSGTHVGTLLRDGSTLWIGGEFGFGDLNQNLVAFDLGSNEFLPQAPLRLAHRVEALNRGPQDSVWVGVGTSVLGGQRTSQNIVHLDSKGDVNPGFALHSAANARGFNGSSTATTEAEKMGAVKVIRRDGSKILVGGAMTSFHGNPVPRGLVRLLEDGQLDTSFGFNGSTPMLGAAGSVPLGSNLYELRPVNAILRLDENRILVGGNFQEFHGQPRSGLAVLGNDGSLRSETVLFPTSNYAVTVLEPVGESLIFVGLERSNDGQSHAYIIRRDLTGDPVSLSVSGNASFFEAEVLVATGRVQRVGPTEVFDLIVGGGFSPERAVHLRFFFDAQGNINPLSVEKLTFPTWSAVVAALNWSDPNELFLGGSFNDFTLGTTYRLKRGLARLNRSSSSLFVPADSFNSGPQSPVGGIVGGQSRVYALGTVPPGQWSGSSGALLVGSQNFGTWTDGPSFGQRPIRGLFGLSGDNGFWNEFVSGYRQMQSLTEP